jgi:hypothetical protein
MAAAYTILLQDFSYDTPEDIDVIPSPSNILQTPETQVLHTYQKLQRSARRHDRIMTLVYAYYLGEILENNFSRSQRSYLNSHISKYYSLSSRRTYYLFEKVGVQQIYRTRSTTLSLIYRMKQSDFLALTED